MQHETLSYFEYKCSDKIYMELVKTLFFKEQNSIFDPELEL